MMSALAPSCKRCYSNKETLTFHYKISRVPHVTSALPQITKVTNESHYNANKPQNIMCECHYMRIQCESPGFVKAETGCQGKVRDKMFERTCVHYCEIKKIVENGREGKKKWKTDVCRACKKYYEMKGWMYDPSRVWGMGNKHLKPTAPWNEGKSRCDGNQGGSLSGSHSRKH